MACKFQMLFVLLSVCISSSISEQAASDSVELDWADFDAAISEDDCFGSHCGRASGALSLMQRKITTSWIEDTREVARVDATYDDLSEAFASEEVEEIGHLSLVQTGASVERAAVAPENEHMMGSVDVDGSIHLNFKVTAAPADGMMHFSVDAGGHIDSEAGVSLLQTESHVEQKSEPSSLPAIEKASSSLKVRKADEVAASDFNDYEETEGLSMMQTDVHDPSHREAIAVQADGDLEFDAKEIVVPSNGVMHFSVDGHGDFHSEDALYLVQTKAKVEEVEEEWSDAMVGGTVVGHPTWTLEAVSDVDAFSLMQTDFHMVAPSQPADDVQPHKANKPSAGMMHLSVDSQGHFHQEI